MRYFGNRQVPQITSLPDTVLTLLLTAGSGQAFDYPSNADLVRVSPGSTAAGFSNVYFNPSSTGAVVATTAGVITTATTALNIVVAVGDSKIFQRPRGTTGFSLISVSSLPVSVEFWSRAGTTA